MRSSISFTSFTCDHYLAGKVIYHSLKKEKHEKKMKRQPSGGLQVGLGPGAYELPPRPPLPQVLS